MTTPRTARVREDAQVTAMSNTLSHSSDTLNLLARVRCEYLEMPGLTLTPAQARRLWNLSEPICEQVLLALLKSGFLRRTWRNAFVMA
jgi:hypothetical protein